MIKDPEKSNQVELTLGYSPCPNDTYMFDGIANQGLGIDGIGIRHSLFDVETLNEMAMNQVLDITKLSFHAFFNASNHYQLIHSGSALGYNCGPVLISKQSFSKNDMKNRRVVFPGAWTTAHLLFRLWAPEAENRFFVPYDRIFNCLEKGEADCGVIIHESRFTFESMGYKPIVDLGAWWEKKTRLPIPLGCIAARKRLGEKMIGKVEHLIRRSIKMAMEDPGATIPYIRKYAMEMDEAVLKKHIRTFVNSFSLDLGKTGKEAVEALERMAKQAGVIQ